MSGNCRYYAGIWVALGAGLLALPAKAQTSAAAHQYAERYDIADRVVGTIAPDPDGAGGSGFAAVRNSYSNGNLVRTEIGELAAWQADTVMPANWSGFTIFRMVDYVYDTMDRKVRETHSASGTVYRVIQYSHNAAGQVVCTAERLNPAAYGALPADACALGTQGSQGPDRITLRLYQGPNRLLGIKKAVGTPLEQAYVTYTFTANGKLASVKDANGNVASYNYDSLDRQSHWYFPSKTTPGQANTADYEQYGYDANGNRTSLRKRDGQVINYSYDALNRVTLKDVPGSTKDVSYSYDLRGLQVLAKFNDASKYVSAAYDGLGRLAGTWNNMDGRNLGITYQYDANGNRTRVTHPDGTYFTYEYDGLDRMIRIRENGGSELVGIGYNNKGERSCQGNTVSASACGGTTVTAYGYDGISRLTSHSHDLFGTNGDVYTSLSYNPASQITGTTRNNDAYAWNGHVNVNRGYAVNGLNQYTSAGPASFTYDGNGNLTSDGGTTYAYDSENRLTSASGAKNASLTYDPQGRLWETTGNSVTTRFLYDGDELIAEYASNGALLRRYVHGAGSDDPLIWYEAGQAWPSGFRRIHTDHQGSVTAIADGTGGLLAIDSYDEYGIPASGNLGRFQYTGQAWLPEIGMYYYKARIYSPTLGRFLQTDPIGYDDQINLYAYVANDPVNRSDPTGKQSVQDQQLQAQIDDMRQQGMSEKQIQQEIGRQAGIEGSLLSLVAPLEGALVKGGALLKGALGIGEKAATSAKAEGVAGKVAAESSAVQTTAHGAERIAGPNATRGGVLSQEGVAATRANGRAMTQADGANVFVAQGSSGRFNVVVQNGEGKVVTTFENLSQKSLDRLGRNYGWRE